VSLWYQIKVYYRSYQHAELRRAKVKLWALDQMKSQPSCIDAASLVSHHSLNCGLNCAGRKPTTGPHRLDQQGKATNERATMLQPTW